MNRVAVLGLFVLGAATLAHGATRDAGDTGSTPDAAADPWADDAKAAADADSDRKAKIEQQARAQCIGQLNAADYEARNNYQYPQFVAASRRAADDCLTRARAYLRRQADEQAAFFEHQREAAQRAEEQHRRTREQEQAKRASEVQAQAEEDTAEQREVEARAKDPAFGRARLSALLCYVASSRKHAKQMIDNERQGARAGLGVIDKEVVYEWQGEIVTMSKLEAIAHGELHKRKASALPCKPDAVKEFDECIHGARQATLLLGPGDDEYLEDAKRIFDAGANCTPWQRLTPPAPAAAGTSSAGNTADRQ